MDKKIEKKIEKEIIEHPLGDDEIKYYLPDANIIKYSDLKKYKSIDALLPHNKSYSIILYENSPNVGHWVCIMKYNDKKRGDVIEFFDSLADDGKPDSQLNWTKPFNKMLGQGKNYLSNLLNNTDKEVIYNKFKFQSEGNKKDGNNINSCGRHCVFRIKNLLDCDRNLEEYFKYMADIHKESNNTYDEIVSNLVGGEQIL
jgi:hypothetical protein